MKLFAADKGNLLIVMLIYFLNVTLSASVFSHQLDLIPGI